MLRRIVPVLASLAVAAGASSPAYAGAKPTSAWDPVNHATAGRSIHLYPYLRLVRNLWTERAVSHGIAGTGHLQERHVERIHPHSPIVSVWWTSVKVRYQLTTLGACPDVFGGVYRHLFVRKPSDTTYRNRPHYHDTVNTDCP